MQSVAVVERLQCSFRGDSQMPGHKAFPMQYARGARLLGGASGIHSTYCDEVAAQSTITFALHHSS